MSCWEILGIPEHSDAAAIRHAYAVLAERYHPEEHEEEFLRVRDAYREAMALARGRARPAEDREQAAPPPEKPKQPVLRQKPEPHPEPTPVPQPSVEKAEEPSPAEEPQRPAFVLQEEKIAAEELPPDFPALAAFRELYVSPRRRDRAAWDNYVSSPEFLFVVKNEPFLRAVRAFVEEQAEAFPPNRELQTVLAIVYRYRAVPYEDHVEFELASGAGFQGIEHVLAIAELGPLSRGLRGNDDALQAGFEDYFFLDGLANKRAWGELCNQSMKEILQRYAISYIKEKCSKRSETERSVLSLRLLEYFFSANSLPASAYETLWNTLLLESATMGRAKILYGRLREIALSHIQEMEQEDFSDVQSAVLEFAKRSSVDDGRHPEKLRALADALFAREDLHRALRNRAFCDRYVLYSWFFENEHPIFFEHLLACCEDDQIPLRDEIRRKAKEFLDDHRKLSEREEDDRTEPSLESCWVGSRPFLRYFLFRAFLGARLPDGSLSLEDILWESFWPSRDWARKLGGYNVSGARIREPFSLSYAYERRSSDGSIVEPLEMDVVFRRFCVEYFCNGQPAAGPLLPFEVLQEMEDDGDFFLMLPVAMARQEELETVQEEIACRLQGLPLPQECMQDVAGCLASFVCCLGEIQTEQGESGLMLLRPLIFWRERPNRAYACLWYSNGRMYAVEMTDEGMQVLPDGVWDDVTADQAAGFAESVLDGLCEEKEPEDLSFQQIPIVRARTDGSLERVYSEPEVNEKLACDQIQDFCEGKLNRLEFEWPKEGYSLVLMRDKDQYACFIFDDVKQMTCTYLSNPKAYQTVDSELVQYVPFFLGKLPFYAVHENMENICAILPGILSKLSQPAPKEQRLKMLSIFTWSQKVYLYSSAQRYWFDRRTVGDFPPGRGTLSLTGKFQIEKQPDLLLLEEKDGALREEPVSAQNRSAVYTNLVGFFLGRVRRFGMAWNLPEGEVRLRLECEGDGDEKRYALSVTREGRTEYLAIEKELGWSAKERMRWELTRIRDFMDLFLMSLPDVKRLLSMLEKLGTLR